MSAQNFRGIEPRRPGDEPRPIEFAEPKPTPGTCRYCGCTESRACVDFHPARSYDLDDDPGAMAHPCHWSDDDRTVCNVCARVTQAQGWPQTDAEAHELAALCQWHLWQYFAFTMGLAAPPEIAIDADRCARIKSRCAELAGPIPNRAVTLLIGS